MNMTWVVKVGGSLLNWKALPDALRAVLGELSERGHRGILVVGGGAVADAVRRFDRSHGLDESEAHRLALHALDLTARFVVSLVTKTALVDRLDQIEPCWDEDLWPVLAPRHTLEEDDRLGGCDLLPHNWAVTSDSIAARVAVLLPADGLLLLKSTDLPAGTDRRSAVQLGLVDDWFPHASRRLDCVEYRNLRDPGGSSLPLACGEGADRG